MRLIDADALTEFLKCLLPERGMWEIEGDTAKDAICETVAEAIEMVKNMETIQPEKAQLSQEDAIKDTTSDTIYRQAAIDALCSQCTVDKPETCSTIQKGDNWCEEVYILQKVPSAQLERKRGCWVGIDDEPCDVYECDQCGTTYDTIDNTWDLPYFCPNCGADMRGEQDE